MKITVYDKVTGAASKHWPVDVNEILQNGRGRYTVDPKQVKGDVSNPQLEEAPSPEEQAHLQFEEAQAELHEASAALAEHNEAEAHRLRELGEMEAESGEPVTPQVYPTHFLDEEQANYPTDWKYRRHSVSDYGQPQPAGKIKRMPSVSTVSDSDAETRRQAAMRKATEARAALSQATPVEGKPRGSAKDSKVVSQRKQELEAKKAQAESDRQARKAQREQERADRKAAREQAKAAKESGEQEDTGQA